MVLEQRLNFERGEFRTVVPLALTPIYFGGKLRSEKSRRTKTRSNDVTRVNATTHGAKLTTTATQISHSKTFD